MESELGNKRTVPGGSATKQDKGKDKGKVTAQDERQPHAGDSIVSRIGKSASGLSRSIAHGTPTATDLADVVPSEKSETPPRGKLVAPGESSSAVLLPNTPGKSVFRSGHTHAYTAAEESAFSEFLDNTPALVPTEPVGLEHTWHQATRGSSRPSVYGHSKVPDVSSVAEQQGRDGSEVVRLLSQTDEEMPSNECHIVVSETELKSLRQALFEDGLPDQLSATDWNNALNFVPDFLRRDSEDGEVKEFSVNSYTNLGVTELAEAGSLWLEHWNRVLTSYTDEVWGDLGDLVKTARTEVDELKEGNNVVPTDVPAVRQLRSILTRVRARL